ncbi:MAG: carbohydrate kinase [Planctomycetes bacterium]|nr:carbohydrate kinase [Planctomycetota bacterium]
MQNNRKYLFIGLGEILWDILPDETHLGGAPANFAYHAGALGADAVVVSAVGNDSQGEKILKKLKAMNLSTEYIKTSDKYPTGSVTVDINEQGNPSYEIHENSAWDFIEFSPKLNELAQNADVICFGSLAQRRQVSRDTIQSFLKSAKPTSLRIFDVNIRQNFYSKQILEQSLQAANILKINTKELKIIAELLDTKRSEDTTEPGALPKPDVFSDTKRSEDTTEPGNLPEPDVFSDTKRSAEPDVFSDTKRSEEPDVFSDTKRSAEPGVFSENDEKSLLKDLLNRCDLSLIALTRGFDGSTLVTAERISNHRGFHLEPVDTVGAGDAFLAALSWGLINKLDLDLINNYANHIAGYVCTQTGATPIIPKELLRI